MNNAAAMAKRICVHAVFIIVRFQLRNRDKGVLQTIKQGDQHDHQGERESQDLRGP